MRSKFVAAALLAANLIALSVTLPAAFAQNTHNLPKTIYGPAVGSPGDNVSRGNFGGNAGGNYSSNGSANVGLPAVRTSAFMGEPGDNIRSDMGHRISGQAVSVNNNQRPAAVGLPAVRTSAYMGQPGDHIRSDLGRRINGQVYQRPARVQYNTQQQNTQVYTPAYTYNDYTKSH
jgi:hypothetical protein